MEKSRDFMGGSRGEEGSFLLSLLTNCMPGSPWTRQGGSVQRIRDNLSNVFLEDFKLLVQTRQWYNFCVLSEEDKYQKQTISCPSYFRVVWTSAHTQQWDLQSLYLPSPCPNVMTSICRSRRLNLKWYQTWYCLSDPFQFKRRRLRLCK